MALATTVVFLGVFGVGAIKLVAEIYGMIVSP